MGYQEPQFDLRESLMHRNRFSEPASAANDRILRKSRLINKTLDATKIEATVGLAVGPFICSVLFP